MGRKYDLGWGGGCCGGGDGHQGGEIQVGSANFQSHTRLREPTKANRQSQLSPRRAIPCKSGHSSFKRRQAQSLKAPTSPHLTIIRRGLTVEVASRASSFSLARRAPAQGPPGSSCPRSLRCRQEQPPSGNPTRRHLSSAVYPEQRKRLCVA
jgi:hypothetical protein